MLRHPLQTIASLITLLLMIGCTLASEHAPEDPLIQQTRSWQGSNILIQVGASTPSLASKPRSYWVGQRKNKNAASIQKIWATLATGSYEVSETEARHYLKEHPKDPEGLSVLIYSLALQGKYNMARYYGGLLKRFHREFTAWNNLNGLLSVMKTHVSVHDLKLAARQFAEAFAKDEREVAAGLNLGNLYLELGDAEAAIGIFNEVKERCDQCLASLMGAGIAYGRTEQFKLSQESFESALKRQPDYGPALYRLAMIEHQGFKDPDKARGYLQRLLAREEDRYLKQRASSYLRRIEAEKNPQERSS